MKTLITISLLLIAVDSRATCAQDKVILQVSGSGGPELTDQRASSSYPVWVNDKTTVMVDTGSGSAFNFGKAGADFNDVVA